MEQVNFRPGFETVKVPCTGQVGDLIVITPLSEGKFDDSPQGLASMWFCIRDSNEERPAIWARIQFDGVAWCEFSQVREPIQDRPALRGG